MGAIDLHVHSRYSDGTLTPAMLVDLAVEKGLRAIALTDHDTIDGIDEMLAYAKGKPIEVIPGIEYSTEYNGRDVHILGLFIDHKAPVFLEYLVRFKQSRTDRNHKLCANLRQAGIDITYEELLEAYPDAVITRSHYAALLLRKGHVMSANEAFERYLGDHTPYFVHREKITPEEVIDVTLRAGGIPVLAHPTLYQLGQEQLDVLVQRLKDAGLMGIECKYCTYTPTEERRMRALAKRYGLLASGGSDYHGVSKPGLELGTGYGKRLYVDESLLEEMKRSLSTKILFTDLDGTLLTTDKEITPASRAAVLRMLVKGHHFVLASGRPINSILDVFRKLDIHEKDIEEESRRSRSDSAKSPVRPGRIYATAYNGALLYDCLSDTVMERYGVPISTAQAIFDMALMDGIHIQTYSDTHIVACADDRELAFYTRAVKMGHITATALEKVLEHPPCKVLAVELDDRTRLERLREKVQGSAAGQDIVCAFSNRWYLEFYNRKAGKGNALRSLCRMLGVHIKNSVAAGDEENDVTMLEAAAVGVCMANGNPAVKARADHVTEHGNDEDGIVEVIEKYI